MVAVEAPAARGTVRTARLRIVNALLFLAILSSPVVLFEPAPYEGMIALLGLVSLAAGITVHRAFVPLGLLLLVWNLSGLVALAQVTYDDDAVTFTATSFYLGITAFLFACLFSEDTLQRLAHLRTAYILAAVAAAVYGLGVYFGVLPGEQVRVQSTFKDPNVFGPFLVLPILFLVDALLRRGFGLFRLLAAAILVVALFLSFSRGAWAHLVVSALLMIFLMFLLGGSLRFRARVLVFGILAALGVAGVIGALLSFGNIGEFFAHRAALFQEYDAGQTGRFARQGAAMLVVLDTPLGVGPLQFGKLTGLDPHNVYLNAFLSYGWLGGISYLILIAATLVLGFRALCVRTPWQPHLVAIYAAFTGAVLEGIVIDTDHWRHFFLLLGLIWGLAAVTERYQRPASSFARAPGGLAPTGPQLRS